MKIPTRFKLMGKTVVVQYDKNIFHNDDRHGIASFRKDTIVLQSRCEGINYSQANIELTFLHELVHHISYHAGSTIQHKMGNDYLYRDEGFVDLFANLLHQALTTMEYEGKNNERKKS